MIEGESVSETSYNLNTTKIMPYTDGINYNPRSENFVS
jgi:hypothetical protein